MEGFDSDIEILKEIKNNGNYIWTPKNCNGVNHVLGCTLTHLVEREFLMETDISTGFWIFGNSQLEYSITKKGIDFLEDTKKLKNVTSDVTTNNFTKFCTECGTKINENFKFCYNCGLKIKNVTN